MFEHEREELDFNASNFNREAVRLQSAGQFRTALEFFKRAFNLYSRLGDREGQGRTLNGVGAILKDLGLMQEARQNLEMALTIRREVGNQQGEAITLLTLGPVYQALGQSKNALGCLIQALSLTREIPDRSLEGDVLYNLGQVSSDLGQFNEAQQHFESALAIARETGNIVEETKCLNSLGLISGVMGHWRDALVYYEKALYIARQSGNAGGEETVLHNLGVAHLHFGQYEDAETYLKKALEITEMTSGFVAGQRTLAVLGDLYLQLNNLEAATGCYEAALKIAKENGNRYELAAGLFDAGAVFMMSKNPAKARDYLEQSLAIYREVGSLNGEGAALKTLGQLHYDLGQKLEAVDLLKQSLKIAQQTEHKVLEGEALRCLGIIYDNEGQLEMACSMYQSALDIFDSIRGEASGDELRSAYYGSWGVQMTYSRCISALMRVAKSPHDFRVCAAEAFHVCERSRARALLDLLAHRGSDTSLERSEDISPGMLEYVARIRWQMSEGLRRLALPSLSKNERVQLSQQRDEMDLEYRRLQAFIQAQHPHYASLIQPESLTLVQIQEQMLDERTVLLEYKLGPDASFLWLITKTTWQIFRLPAAADIVRRVVELVGASQHDSSNYTRTAHELYRLLVEPTQVYLQEHAGGNETELPLRLIVVPDDVLQVLPFEMLLTENDERAFLVRQYAIVYAPSASALATIIRERRPAEQRAWDKEFIGFAPVEFRSAPNLPCTEQEICNISNIFAAEKATVCLRDGATKNAVQSLDLRQYRYLHFATHGHTDLDRPQFCGLLFSDSEGDDLLRTFEIFRLKLNADLVVASACRTGLGKAVHGEGMVGLMRAFFYAGTPSICLSLWSVADASTAELMQKFYRHLIMGKMDKAESLRRAKLEMLDESPWPHPYHWASFLLIGDWQ